MIARFFAIENETVREVKSEHVENAWLGMCPWDETKDKHDLNLYTAVCDGTYLFAGFYLCLDVDKGWITQQSRLGAVRACVPGEVQLAHARLVSPDYWAQVAAVLNVLPENLPGPPGGPLVLCYELNLSLDELLFYLEHIYQGVREA